VTPASQRLLELAEHLAARYRYLPIAQASMVTGSVADGLSDFYSDIDMAVYYSELPSEEDLAKVRQTLTGSSERRWLLGDREKGTLIESFAVGGVECQVIHSTTEAIQEQINSILLEHQVVTPTHKAMSGLLKCIPFFGEDLIQSWKTRIAQFPEPLAEKMVRHYLNFFPIWGLTHQFTQRDARLFYQQSLLEAVQNLLGLLSGLNRVYYSTFQFKRSRKFTQTLKIAPEGLYERLERLFELDVSVAGAELEALVQETLALVEAHMSQVDTQPARRRIGWRQQPWQFETLERAIQNLSKGFL
jgi:predicted nucleotidyltransferase